MKKGQRIITTEGARYKWVPSESTGMLKALSSKSGNCLIELDKNESLTIINRKRIRPLTKLEEKVRKLD